MRVGLGVRFDRLDNPADDSVVGGGCHRHWPSLLGRWRRCLAVRAWAGWLRGQPSSRARARVVFPAEDKHEVLGLGHAAMRSVGCHSISSMTRRGQLNSR